MRVSARMPSLAKFPRTFLHTFGLKTTGLWCLQNSCFQRSVFPSPRGQIPLQFSPGASAIHSVLLQRMLTSYHPPPKSLPVMFPLLTRPFNHPSLYDSCSVFLTKSQTCLICSFQKN